MAEAVDVLILGGGTSGSALAGVLAERGDLAVLVAEAGPDPGPREGGGWPHSLLHAGELARTHDWGYVSGAEIPGRTVPFERARVLGGCSSHNGCAAIWGHRLDYDAWAAAGCAGWSTDEVAPFLAAATTRLRVHDQPPDVLTPLQAAAREALIAAGVPATDDLNDLDEDLGVAGSPVNIVDGVRFNAAFAYLDPVRGAPVLEIRGDTLADRLLVRGGRVVGARLIGPECAYDQPAGRTIVCGGAYGSPAILQRSGIGDPEALRRAGIEPSHDLAGVGQNLHDHPAAVLGFAPSARLAEAMAAFAAGRWCPEEQVIAKARSSRCAEAFDLHVYPVHGAGAERVDLPVACMTPRSRGTLHVRSADPEATPAIDHGYLTDPDGADAAVLRDGLALVRELAASSALAPLLGDLVAGGMDPAPIVQHYYHPVGTCKMGPPGDAAAVVGPDGAIHGLECGYVCDCSIIPVVPRANTNVPAVMLAERLAAIFTAALERTRRMADEFDYVVVGGGSAGAVVGARLSEDPGVSVCVIEAGPDDRDHDVVLKIRRWLELLESDFDYGYTTTLQPRGNAHIVHSRARVLGGCSSHNTMIWFKPFPGDWQDWVDRGASGWDAATIEPYYERIPGPHGIVQEKDRNAILYDWIEACGSALGVAKDVDWNAAPYRDGAGFLDVGYNFGNGVRSSSSVMYLHPIMDSRSNLSVQCDTRAMRLEVQGGRAVAVHVQRADGGADRIAARREIVVSCGSVDSPRLLLYSGIGPRAELEHLGIDVVHDLPGVGENLIDHPESIIIWKLRKPMGPEGCMDADCALFVNRLGADDRPDLMYHTYQLPFTFNTERLGYEVPDDRWCICMTPNIPRSHSAGRLSILSKNPDVKPALDFRYFTDEDGYDEQTVVDGLKLAREVAATGPFADWIEREIAPGEKITSDVDLSTYGRAVHHTVYHPSGTCRMGAGDDDLAVVDPDLRVRGIAGLSVVDGSIFPQMPTVNPVVATFMIGERAADLIRART